MFWLQRLDPFVGPPLEVVPQSVLDVRGAPDCRTLQAAHLVPSRRNLFRAAARSKQSPARILLEEPLVLPSLLRREGDHSNTLPSSTGECVPRYPQTKQDGARTEQL